MPRKLSSAAKDRLKALQPEALALRIQGLDYREIAKRLGIKKMETVYRMVQDALAERAREAREKAEILLAAELAKLDRIEAELWPIILGDDVRKKLLAIDRYLGVAERRAKLLGLETTTNITQTAIILQVQGAAPEEVMAVLPPPPGGGGQ